ncbi:hypothetical protein GCM10009847_08940 [Leucobacter tardus]
MGSGSLSRAFRAAARISPVGPTTTAPTGISPAAAALAAWANAASIAARSLALGDGPVSPIMRGPLSAELES